MTSECNNCCKPGTVGSRWMKVNAAVAKDEKIRWERKRNNKEKFTQRHLTQPVFQQNVFVSLKKKKQKERKRKQQINIFIFLYFYFIYEVCVNLCHWNLASLMSKIVYFFNKMINRVLRDFWFCVSDCVHTLPQKIRVLEHVCQWSAGEMLDRFTFLCCLYEGLFPVFFMFSPLWIFPTVILDSVNWC